MNDQFASRFFPPGRGRLLDLARGLLGTQADAEDVVQDAYLRVRDGAPPGLASTEAWLMTVVKHLAIDRLRRRRLEWDWQARAIRDGDAGDSRSAPSAEHLATLAIDSAAALRLVTDTLAPVEAAALLLREVFDADYADIARSTGKGEAACRQLVHRALQRVRAASLHAKRKNQPADGDTADALFHLCWRAIESRSPQALHAVLAAPQMAASVRVPAQASGTQAGVARTSCVLAQVNGRFAVALVLDGKVLCTLPIGPTAASTESEAALCSAP